MSSITLKWKDIPNPKPLSPRERAGFVSYVIREFPVGCEIGNYALQGALRFYIPGIPAQQDYTRELDAAVEAGWLGKLGPDRYRRIKPTHHKSKHWNSEELSLRIRSALGDWHFQN
jgi:hypothetical protein